jgi:hypothetical protein
MRDHLLNPTWISYKSSLMPPYATLLSDHHYSILLEKTASESDAYLSLLAATNPLLPNIAASFAAKQWPTNCWLWRPYFVRTLLPKYRGRSKGRRNALKLSQHKDNA